MIPCEPSKYLGYPQAKFTPEEREELMAQNAHAIAWLENIEKDCSSELRRLRRHIKARRRLQGLYEKNEPSLTEGIEFRISYCGRSEKIFSGVMAFPHYVRVDRNGIVRPDRRDEKAYPEHVPGEGEGRVTESC